MSLTIALWLLCEVAVVSLTLLEIAQKANRFIEYGAYEVRSMTMLLWCGSKVGLCPKLRKEVSESPGK